MRPFDYKTSWLDDEGKPLAGRAKFCRLHTTELENIYDINGTPLSNPIYTNTIGQLDSQVFLSDDKDYTVRFEKYVGAGDMRDDPENWLFQYSCDSVWDVYGISVNAVALQMVNTISSLRSLSPASVADRDGRKAVILGGYNEIGDKPQVMYVWNATSIENDNGGSVIKVESISTGRWELVNTFGSEGIDVRHFGAFAAPSRQEASDMMSLAIGYANEYAVDVGLPLFFPQLNGLSWYKINNLNIAGAKFAKDTRIFGNSGTSSVITVTDENQYLYVYSDSNYEATFTITGEVVRTSWGIGSNRCVFDPTFKLIADSAITTVNRIFNDLIVEFVSTDVHDDLMFFNCQISANGNIGDNCGFRKCRLTERMFNSHTDFETISVNRDDTIEIDDFPTTSKWLTLRAKVPVGDIDFRGRTVDSSCHLDWTTSCKYLNAVFSNFNAEQATVVIENCTGSINLTSPILSSFTVRNSTLFAAVSDITISGSFTAVDSEVTFDRTFTADTVNVTRSTIIQANDSHIIAATTIGVSSGTINSKLRANVLNASYSTLARDITILSTVAITDSLINGTISQSTYPTVNFYLRNNTFADGAHHSISGSSDGVTVVGSWINNTALGTNPIIINNTNLAQYDGDHTYTYVGNVGGFLPSKTSVSLPLTVDKIPLPIQPTAHNNKVYFINPGIVINPQGLSWYSGVMLDMEASVIPLFYIGSNVKFKESVTVTWNATESTYYTNTNLYPGRGSATASAEFPPIGGSRPTTDRMNGWIQQFIQCTEDDTITDAVATVTAEVLR